MIVVQSVEDTVIGQGSFGHKNCLSIVQLLLSLRKWALHIKMSVIPKQLLDSYNEYATYIHLD